MQTFFVPAGCTAVPTIIPLASGSPGRARSQSHPVTAPSTLCVAAARGAGWAAAGRGGGRIAASSALHMCDRQAKHAHVKTHSHYRCHIASPQWDEAACRPPAGPHTHVSMPASLGDGQVTDDPRQHWGGRDGLVADDLRPPGGFRRLRPPAPELARGFRGLLNLAVLCVDGAGGVLRRRVLDRSQTRHECVGSHPNLRGALSARGPLPAGGGWASRWPPHNRRPPPDTGPRRGPVGSGTCEGISSHSQVGP